MITITVCYGRVHPVRSERPPVKKTWPLLKSIDLEPQRELKQTILEIQDCGMENGYLEITP